MAKKKRLTQDELRDLVDTPALIQLLQDDAHGLLDPPLNQTRSHNARFLIGLTLPALQAIQVAGEFDGKLELSWQK